MQLRRYSLSKTRIGFVVTAGHHRGFLRVHQHLLESLDPRKFEVVFLCPKSVVAPCRSAVKRDDIIWATLPDRFDLAVDTLRQHCCDVLYHWKVGDGTLNYFLPFAKAAPVQCTSYGTHGTGGVSTVDYYLTSPYLEAVAGDYSSHYTEKTYLFRNHIGYLSLLATPAHPTRDEFSLKDSETVYLCPHRLPKFQPRFDPYLRDILDADPNGRIVLLTRPEKFGNDILQDRLKRSLGKQLFQRLVFLPFQQPDALQRLFAVSDIVLDSPLYSGSLTAYDAFTQSVPVVTQPGELAVQCYAAGLYRRMELDDFAVPDNRDEYVRQAVRLGTDRDYREFVRRQIFEKRSLIFDDRQCILDFERFFESVTSIEI